MYGIVPNKYLVYSLLAIGLWSLLYAPVLPAQQLTYETSHYSKDEGLRNHRLYDVLEHSSGFVYVGTPSGVDRFDGYNFYPVDLPKYPSLMTGAVGPRVYQLFEMLNHEILIVYESGYDEEGFLFADIYDPYTEEITSTRVQPLSLNDQLKVLSDSIDTKMMTYFIELGERKVQYLRNMYDYEGNQLVTSPDRDSLFLKLRSGAQLDLTSPWSAMTTQKWGEGNNFEEHIYFRTLNGLIKVDVRKSPFTTFLSDMGEDWEYHLSCRSIKDLGNGKILFSPEQESLAILEEATGEIKRLNFLEKETGEKIKIQSVREVVVQSDSVLLVTAYEEGLCELNIFTEEARRLGPLDMVKTFAFYESIQRTNGQIVLTVKEKKLDKRYAYVLQYNPAQAQLDTLKVLSEIFSIPEFRFTFLLEAKREKLWIGTNHGLFLVDLEKDKILGAWYDKRQAPNTFKGDFPEHYILEGSGVLTLYETEDDLLWIGLEEGGVNILNTLTNDLQILSEEDGLSNNTVCGILPYENGYWLSTYNGLSYYNKETKDFRNFYRQQGLPHNEFNRFSFERAKSGIFYFGGMNGYVGFDPEEVLSEEKEVKIYISEASYYDRKGKPIVEHYNKLKKEVDIDVPANYRNCRFNFTLSDLHTAKQHTYSYRLVPVGQIFTPENIPWINNGTNRSVAFDYIPAGNYELEVRGISARGVLSETMSIKISVNEFIYRTWWFITLIILGISGIAYMFYRNRIQNAIRMEKLRTQLSSDLHDDVGSLLSGVAYQMELLEYSVGDQHKSLVQQIASSSRRAMSQMRDVVWAMDNRKGSLQDLVERMREFASELLEPLEIDYQFDAGSLLTSPLSSEQRHSILLIFKEFLTNTVKHAEATKVEIQLRQSGKFFELSLKDNGKGMSKNLDKITGQGLLNMQMRADKIKADLNFDNHNGFGVLLRLKLF